MSGDVRRDEGTRRRVATVVDEHRRPRLVHGRRRGKRLGQPKIAAFIGRVRAGGDRYALIAGDRRAGTGRLGVDDDRRHAVHADYARTARGEHGVADAVCTDRDRADRPRAAIHMIGDRDGCARVRRFGRADQLCRWFCPRRRDRAVTAPAQEIWYATVSALTSVLEIVNITLRFAGAAELTLSFAGAIAIAACGGGLLTVTLSTALAGETLAWRRRCRML